MSYFWRVTKIGDRIYKATIFHCNNIVFLKKKQQKITKTFTALLCTIWYVIQIILDLLSYWQLQYNAHTLIPRHVYSRPSSSLQKCEIGPVIVSKSFNFFNLTITDLMIFGSLQELTFITLPKTYLPGGVGSERQLYNKTSPSFTSEKLFFLLCSFNIST